MTPHSLKLLLCLAVPTLAGAELPEGYELKAAAEKQEILWEHIEDSAYDDDTLPSKGPGLGDLLKFINAQILLPTLKHVSDELPQGRKKILHPFGSSAKVALRITKPSKATGIFQSGGLGIARLSLGTQSTDSYIPGMAVKILIDGKPSINLQVMERIDGQGGNLNFFQNTFTNNPAEPKSGILRFAQKFFDRAARMVNKDGRANLLHLDHAAAISADGSSVTRPVTPVLVIFRPTKEAQMDPTDKRDLRIKLRSVKPGTVLYKVLVLIDPKGLEEEIGQLELQSPLVPSEYGDQTLFFKHNA